MNPQDPSQDILQWPDGFWCFQEELCAEFLRDDNYRVLLCGSDEWLRIISARKPLSPPRHIARAATAAHRDMTKSHGKATLLPNQRNNPDNFSCDPRYPIGVFI